MISLSEESLKAIKYIKNAKALSYFRRMVFRRSSLNYGETILGVNELKEKSELVKVPDSNYRFKLKFPQRRRTFKEFLATLVNDELLTKNNLGSLVDNTLYTYPNMAASETANCKLVFWVDYYYTESAKTFLAKVKVTGESIDIIVE